MNLDKVIAHIQDGVWKSSHAEQSESRFHRDELHYCRPQSRMPTQPPRWTFGDAVLVTVCGAVWGLSLTYLMLIYWEML